METALIIDPFALLTELTDQGGVFTQVWFYVVIHCSHVWMFMHPTSLKTNLAFIVMDEV